jgi:hypothetical protein
MAKPTKYAPHLCGVFTLIALIGVVIGLTTGNTLWIVLLLLPTAIYEAYRTEGRSTKASSLLLVVVLILEIILIIFKVDFNLAEYLGASEKYIGGYLIPLGELTIVGPAIMAVLSIILFTRTRGVFTKWLAVVIFITSFAIVYSIDPNVFSDLLKYAVDEGMRRI